MTSKEIMYLWKIAKSKWHTFQIFKDPQDFAAQVEVWQGILGDLDPQIVRLVLVANQDPYPPNPTILRLQALDLIDEINGQQVPDFDQAWDELNEARARRNKARAQCEQIEPWVWSHPVIAQAVSNLGWQAYCEADQLKLTTWHAQFRDVYNSTAGRWRKDNHPEIPVLKNYKKLRSETKAIIQ